MYNHVRICFWYADQKQITGWQGGNIDEPIHFVDIPPIKPERPLPDQLMYGTMLSGWTYTALVAKKVGTGLSLHHWWNSVCIASKCGLHCLEPVIFYYCYYYYYYYYCCYYYYYYYYYYYCYYYYYYYYYYCYYYFFLCCFFFSSYSGVVVFFFLLSSPGTALRKGYNCVTTYATILLLTS